MTKYSIHLFIVISSFTISCQNDCLKINAIEFKSNRAYHQGNLYTGCAQDYGTDSTTTRIFEFKNGLQHGWAIEFWKNGKVKRKEGWERGELTGNQYQFYENGAKRIVQECKADKNRCEYKLFSENGELEISGFYQNSKRDGIWFSRNGFTAKNGKQQETYDLYEYFESGIGFNISAAFWKRKPTSELIVKFPSGCKKFQFSQSEMKVLDIEDCECNDNFITP